MSQFLTVARPYARAIFSHAEKQDQGILWLNISLVLATMARTKKFFAVVRDPQIEQSTLVDFIVKVTMECVPDADKIEKTLKNYVLILADRGRLAILDDIHTLYMDLLAEKQGTRNIDVVSAYAASDLQKKQLQAALEDRFSCRINLAYTEDSQLIGGATIRSGSWVMDGSIQDKLTNLRYMFKD